MMWVDASWGWWLAPLLIVACMFMMGSMMGHGHHHGSHASRENRQGPGAERILAERLARGEIDIDEYERRLAVLRTSAGAHRAGEVGHVE